MIDAHRVLLAAEDDFDGWRDAARGLAEAGIPPAAIVWEVKGGEADLFGGDATPAPSGPSFAVPRAFVDLAKAAICHSDPERFALLYALLLKLRSNRQALEDRADPLVDRLEKLAKEVRRDAHKMHAFVRFREMEDEGGPRFVAWFEPDHHIVRREAGFFMRRFANMRWSILTPELCIHWDGAALTTSPGATRRDAPDGDPVEETWKTYYASIFNPGAGQGEGDDQGNAEEILEEHARDRADRRAAGGGAGAGGGDDRNVEEPGGAAIQCPSLMGSAARRGRRLHPLRPLPMRDANRVRRGPARRVDHLRRRAAGRPGGPRRPPVRRARRDNCSTPRWQEAGIDRSTTYVTNAVKHFKFVARGKKRIHARPDVSEIDACRWWQEQERGLIRPALTVALGATAARSLTGKTVTISKVRDAPLTLADGSECWVTVHPSFLLRLPDEAARRSERAKFVADLARIRERAAALAA